MIDPEVLEKRKIKQESLLSESTAQELRDILGKPVGLNVETTAT